MPTEPCDLGAREARAMIGRKQLSPVELTQSCIARIAAIDPALNAITAIDADRALAAAKVAEAAVMAGEPLPLLHGLPIGVKDLEETAGLRSTHGSLLFEHHIPVADDPMVANLRAAGAVVLCKTNTPEFGAGAQTTNRIFGATGNPFDPAKTCSGSSGGSAVALATGMVLLGTGSDLGGSLRTPAAFCGVVGFRPSPGVVPDPLSTVALNPMPVLGPMGRTVDDAVLLLEAMVDFDRRDVFSSGDNLSLYSPIEPADLSTIRVAISTDLGQCPIDTDIAKLFKARVKTFRHVFRSAEDRDPKMDGVHDTFETLRALGFHASFDGLLDTERARLGPNVIANTEAGRRLTVSQIARANIDQTRIYRDFLKLFEGADILISPAAAVSPFPKSQLFVSEINGKTLPTYIHWVAICYALTTALATVACIPCGLDQHGMPFGIQIAGPKGSDAKVLAVAKSLEAVLAADPETRRPVPDLRKLKR